MYFMIAKSAKTGQWYWSLRAANHRVIADSAEGYHNRGDCEDALLLVRNNAATAPLKVAQQGA